MIDCVNQVRRQEQRLDRSANDIASSITPNTTGALTMLKRFQPVQVVAAKSLNFQPRGVMARFLISSEVEPIGD